MFLTFSSSFAGLNAAKSSIKSLDTWMDLEKDYGLAGFKKATDLRKTWPHLKVNYCSTSSTAETLNQFLYGYFLLQVLIAIGGWNEGSTSYSGMAKDPKKRTKFVNSVLAFLEEHNFDGEKLWLYGKNLSLFMIHTSLTTIL